MTETFVIVGAGLAGGGAAATLRGEGFDGRVVLIGAEPQPPYERPPLSSEYLRGESPFELALFQPLDFYGLNFHNPIRVGAAPEGHEVPFVRGPFGG